EKRGTNGFGYDPIFFVPSLDRMMAELTPEEKAPRRAVPVVRFGAAVPVVRFGACRWHGAVRCGAGGLSPPCLSPISGAARQELRASRAPGPCGGHDERSQASGR
ncbi:non-canonical purine NTP pyrophosphatase, partial [Micromonospora orduensis]|uniref:non-canonical purine NTP pyrophosphatase n=1 Tax=Micromonospora orduensis TaxID=1420891 RepID=UPI0033C67927